MAVHAETISNHNSRLLNPSWITSHLKPLNNKGIDDIISLVRSWLNSGSWSETNGTDPVLLWKHIEAHGLGGLAGQMSMRGLLNPGFIEEESTKRYLSNVAQHKNAMKTCGIISRAAADLSIPVAIMKGPALVNEVYIDEGVRSYSDLDIFTDSFSNTVKLIEAIDAEILHRPVSKHHKFGDCVKIDTRINRWICEFTYPVQLSADPVYDLFNNPYGNRTFLFPACLVY